MRTILLSILVPTIPSRARKRDKLMRKLLAQAGGDERVEVIVLEDNKRRSIGRKRDDLIHLAQGRFLTFVDDDDDVADGYIKIALTAIETNPDADVFSSQQECWQNGEGPFYVEFSLDHEDEPMRRLANGRWADLKRSLSHVCIWRADLAKSVRMPDKNYFEHTEWSAEASRLVEKQAVIPEVMHVYVYDNLISEAD